MTVTVTQRRGGWGRLLATTVVTATVVTASLLGRPPSAGADPPPTGAGPSGSPSWLVDPAGEVWALGGAAGYGSLHGVSLKAPIVAAQPTPSGHGYWLVASDGGVFTFGDASWRGSTGAIHLTRPIVAMAATPDGQGYWLIASDGGVFAFGDAPFEGSTGGVRLQRPIVGMVPSPSGQGYWLYADDGGVFAFGDAPFEGSTGGLGLGVPVTGLAPTPDGQGYWEVASDGGVFAFGDASYLGAAAGALPEPATAVIPTSDGAGYWVQERDGSVAPFGDAGDRDDAGQPRFRVPMRARVLAPSTPGETAMFWALEQVGKAYVWGAAGPDTFDCSGLTLRAWQRAGVSVPRVAADQYNAGAHVPLDRLRPGDLVFWAYHPQNPASIHHVALYVGDGQMVNAPHTGANVRLGTVGGAGFVGSGTRP